MERTPIINDASLSIPMISLTLPANLRNRFLERLSKLTDTTITPKEAHDQSSVVLVVLPRGTLTTVLRDFFQTLEKLLRSLATAEPDADKSALRKRLWDAIVQFSRVKINQTVLRLKRTFEMYQSTFHDLITDNFGVMKDEVDVDEPLRAQIIDLYQHINSYDGGDTAPLIQFTASIIKGERHIYEKLFSLIGRTKFVNELYDLMVQLSAPEYAFDTLVRAALTVPAFKGLRIDMKNPRPSALRAPDQRIQQGPRKLATVAQQDHSSSPSNESSTGLSSTPSPPPLPPPPPPPPPIISPATREVTKHLLDTVSRGKLLPIKSAAWFLFGFVTAQNDEQERLVGGLYKQLVPNSTITEATTTALGLALEQGTIVDLLEERGCTLYTDRYPHLDAFLRQKPTQRPTVWRLLHYVRITDPSEPGFVQRDDRSEPGAVLKRDYGFRFCKNHGDMERLSRLYRALLSIADPLEVHQALLNGELGDLVVTMVPNLQRQDLRFFPDDRPDESIGYDNGVGLKPYMQSLFKKSMTY